MSYEQRGGSGLERQIGLGIRGLLIGIARRDMEGATGRVDSEDQHLEILRMRSNFRIYRRRRRYVRAHCSLLSMLMGVDRNGILAGLQVVDRVDVEIL